MEITPTRGERFESERALYADIVCRLQAEVDVRPDDVLINVVEVTRGIYRRLYDLQFVDDEPTSRVS